MKKLLSLMFCLAIGGLVFTSCNKDDDDDDDTTTAVVRKPTLGTQYNASTGGFYSIDENKVYSFTNATNNQAKQDLFCFWEEGNNYNIASPGSSIHGIYDFTSWTTLNLTMFSKVDTSLLKPAQFDALSETDNIIVTLFDTANDRKKAKNLQVDDIWAFKTAASKYGLFKVTAVSTDTTGTVSVFIKMKQ